MTPTQKQIQALEELDAESLIARGAEALHALNRRAKKQRDAAQLYAGASFAQRLRDDTKQIYRAKDKFLAALVRAGEAGVETFVHEPPVKKKKKKGKKKRNQVREWVCIECDRSWRGTDDECRRCHMLGTEYALEPVGPQRWYVVSYGTHRWHVPEKSASAPMRAAAVEIEPHDPSQPVRAIPKIGLTIAAQFAAVQLATAVLNVKAAALRASAPVSSAA